jgi:hypothetical protein
MLKLYHSSSNCTIIGACRGGLRCRAELSKLRTTALTTAMLRKSGRYTLRMLAAFKCARMFLNALHSNCLFAKVTHILELRPECKKTLLSDLVVAVTLCIHKIDCRNKTKAQHTQSVSQRRASSFAEMQSELAQETHS